MVSRRAVLEAHGQHASGVFQVEVQAAVIENVLHGLLGGIDQVIPVSAYVPGCPARPEAIIDGVVKLLSTLEEGTLRGYKADLNGAPAAVALYCVNRARRP